jgi:hypothetical protein
LPDRASVFCANDVAQEIAMREHTERWKQLAELAANEQDPKKLIELVREINELLEVKQRRLDRAIEIPKE